MSKKTDCLEYVHGKKQIFGGNPRVPPPVPAYTAALRPAEQTAADYLVVDAFTFHSRLTDRFSYSL